MCNIPKIYIFPTSSFFKHSFLLNCFLLNKTKLCCTIDLLKRFMLEPMTMCLSRQSHDGGKTLSRQPPNSDTKKHRRAKKMHVPFPSQDTRQRQDAQNIVRLS